MFSPFEELEYLADYLPDEGEAVLVTRRSGELVCESLQDGGHQQALADTAFYGRLVHANERLNSQGAVPLWTSLLLGFWGCVSIHKIAQSGWGSWYLDLGLVLFVLVGCMYWIRHRQERMFQKEIRPMLFGQLRRRQLDEFSLIAAVRQQPELRTLLDQLTKSSA